MKKLLLSIALVLSGLASSAQCSTVSVQISSSDTSIVQLYQAGFFLIDSGYANVVVWEVFDFAGNIVHQDTTSGGFNDQSFSLFNHSIPLTDSMRVRIEITNGVTGEICVMEDTLFWEETEVLPGSFIGNWAVLNSAGGTVIVLGTDDLGSGIVDRIQLYPSIVDDQFMFTGEADSYNLRMIALNGKELVTFTNVSVREPINITGYPGGIYYVQFLDQQNRIVDVRKIVKR